MKHVSETSLTVSSRNDVRGEQRGRETGTRIVSPVTNSNKEQFDDSQVKKQSCSVSDEPLFL